MMADWNVHTCSRTDLPLSNHHNVRSNNDLLHLLLNHHWNVVIDTRAFSECDILDLTPAIVASEKWVLLSSIYTYGNPKETTSKSTMFLDMTEECEHKASCVYGKRKLAAEDKLKEVVNHSNSTGVVVRAPFVIGSGDRSQRVTKLLYGLKLNDNRIQSPKGEFYISIIHASRLAEFITKIIDVNNIKWQIINVDETVKLRFCDHLNIIKGLIDKINSDIIHHEPFVERYPFLFESPFTMSTNLMNVMFGVTLPKPDWIDLWRESLEWECGTSSHMS